MKSTEIKDYYEKYLRDHPYEQERWFKNELQRAGFDMTKNFVRYFTRSLKKDIPKTYLELGPGPGTWTEFFVEQWKDTAFELVELSEEMSALSRARFKDQKSVQLTNMDFNAFNPGKTYDFFFSSRALEYLPNKAKAVQHMHLLLSWGGEGLVITKTPKYMFDLLRGRKISEFHKGQIGKSELANLITKSGMKVLGVYPVTCTVPLLNSPAANLWCSYFLRRLQYNVLTAPFTESYAIYFKKV